MILSLSTKLKIKISQILWVAAVWGLVGVFDSVITWCIANAHYMDPNEYYDFGFDLGLTSIGFSIGGLAAGTLVLFVLKNRWNKRPFWVSFIYSSLVILFFHFCISWLAYVYRFSHELGKPLLDTQVWAEATNYLLGPPHLGNTILIMMLTTGTILWIRVNHRYGPGNLPSGQILPP